MAIRRFYTSQAGFSEAFGAFLQTRRMNTGVDVHAAVAAIVTDVRQRGGAAVVDYTQQFDRLELAADTLSSPAVDLEALAHACPDDVRQAIDFSAERIRDYHIRQTPQDHMHRDPLGVELGWRWSALDSVGLYVPGGRASYPSSVLMNALPAKVAGVPRIVMTAPAPDGVLNPAVAYAALQSGVSEFYPIGGAQAVAALAYGAGPLHPVDKIVGPGNAYVAAAKRIVFGDVGIDTVAGPSEVTVVADGANDPDWIAADLLSQAEHDPLAQSILITDDEAFADRVLAAVDAQLHTLATREVATQSWRTFGAVVIAPLDEAAEIVNSIAPEHVEIATSDPDAVAARIRHAGAIFLGRWAPEPLGDFVTGSNHVLPTSGAARFASGLSLLDFMKRTSVQRVPEAAFGVLADAAETLARAERLPAHGLSLSVRRRS
ncbi:MAG: histidinol dehydrogenase [Hyphomonadaceae bacterium]